MTTISLNVHARRSTRCPQTVGRTGEDGNDDAHRQDDTDPDAAGLSLSVPDDVRRAVKLSHAMECLGKHWRTNLTRASQWSDLSEPCDQIDDFISHDWRTSGVLKYLSLCLLYHTRAAFWSCMIVSVVLGILTTPGPLHVLPASILFEHTMCGKPYKVYFSCWALAFGPLTLILFFLFWQPPGRPRLVFMDKLCIDQVNDDKKHRAIMSLAGFLRLSQSFVLLWSPQYLTRLWCVYEVATWLHLEREFDQLRSVPVGLVAILLNFFMGLWLLLLVYSGARYAHPVVRLGLMAFAIVLLSLISYALNLRLVRSLRDMEEQLSTFSIHDAKCFCCSNQHVHPLTGGIVPCDRVLIYAAIESWIKLKVESGRHSGVFSITQDDCLNAFNELVHTAFAPAVIWKAGGKRVDYKFFICFALVPEICLICDRIPLMAATLDTDIMDGLRYILYQCVMFFCCMPLWLKGQMLAVRSLPRFSSTWRDLVAHGLSLSAWSLTSVFILLVMEVTLAVQSPVGQLLLSPALALATLVAFWEPWDKGRGIRSSSQRIQALKRRDGTVEESIVAKLCSLSRPIDIPIDIPAEEPSESATRTASDEVAAEPGRQVMAL